MVLSLFQTSQPIRCESSQTVHHVLAFFMNLQDQVGKGLSLPTQISSPYSQQSQGTVERLHKTLYGQLRAMKLGLAAHLGIRPVSTEAPLMPWIIQYAVFTTNRYLVRQDGKTSYERVFNKADSGLFVHFQSHSIPPPPPKIFTRGSASEALLFVVGQMCHHHRGSFSSDSQYLHCRSLDERAAFNSVGFSKITLPPHGCEPDYQEPQKDRIVLQELLRSLITQQKSKMLSKDFSPMTQAAVESLAIINFIQEFNSAILSSEVSIVIQTDSSAGKSMASRLGTSRCSKHIELKHLLDSR